MVNVRFHFWVGVRIHVWGSVLSSGSRLGCG